MLNLFCIETANLGLKSILLIDEYDAFANYGNYTFSKNTREQVYNSDMILYFFNKYQQEKGIPSILIDENVRIDYGKLSFLLIESRKLNGNFSILTEVMDQGHTIANLVHGFALANNIDAGKFKSFLCYLGLLTVQDYRYESRFALTIPNEAIRTMHFDYIRRAVEERYDLRIDIGLLSNEFDAAAFTGRWQRLLDYILQQFYAAASIRDFIFREQGIKGFLLAYLNVTPLYFVHSEPEMNHGYADIFLQKNPYTADKTQHEYIIELKYLTEKELRDPTAIPRYGEAAAAQLERYAAGRQVSCTLHRIVVLAGAKEAVLVEEIAAKLP